MQALEKILSKDVVMLICGRLHALCTAELVEEYNRRMIFQGVFPVLMDWNNGDPILKGYNWRRFDVHQHQNKQPIFNKHGKESIKKRMRKKHEKKARKKELND